MRKNLRSERGIALAMVLWILVIFVVLASGLIASARSDLMAVWNFKEDRQTYFLAHAGIQMAIKEIMDDSDFHYYDSEGQLVFGLSGDEGEEAVIYSRTDIPFGGGLVSYFVAEENGKLSLNSLARDEHLLRTFFEYNLSNELEEFDMAIESILDWVDPDDMFRANGAESDYYQTADPPYYSKNGDFETIGELKRVNGVTDEVYAAIEPSLTVYPVGFINFNTASETALLVNGVSSEEIELIFGARNENGYYDLSGKSDIFVVTSWGRFEGSPLLHGIRAVIRKTSQRKAVILSWDDDFIENPQFLSASEEEEGGG